MFAGIFSCTPSFSPEINKVYLILSYLIKSVMLDFEINTNNIIHCQILPRMFHKNKWYLEVE